MKTNFKKSIASAVCGNLMEFYNFILFVYMAPYISHHFFPRQDPFVSLMITISVFSSAYLIRPLGALVMGHIGDKIGRRKALMLSIGLMTLTTLMIGLTPSYEIIGGFATCSIILARLIQGFAVSGEESGAAVYLSECAPANQKGLMGSIIVASAQMGVMAGVLVCFSMGLVLSEEQILAWGWRLPFLIALPFGFISYQLRKNDINHRTDESIAKLADDFKPVNQLWASYKVEVLKAVAIVGSCSLVIYLHNVFLTIYFQHHTESHHGLLFTRLAIIWLCLILPVMGYVADRMGAVKLFERACLALIVLAVPIFVGIQIPMTQAVSLFIFSTLCGAVSAPFFAILVELFPLEVRFTGVSFAFNLAMSLIGSTAPMIALWLSRDSGDLLMVGLYVSLGLSSLFIFQSNISKKYPMLSRSIHVN